MPAGTISKVIAVFIRGWHSDLVEKYLNSKINPACWTVTCLFLGLCFEKHYHVKDWTNLQIDNDWEGRFEQSQLNLAEFKTILAGMQTEECYEEVADQMVSQPTTWFGKLLEMTMNIKLEPGTISSHLPKIWLKYFDDEDKTETDEESKDEDSKKGKKTKGGKKVEKDEKHWDKITDWNWWFTLNQRNLY